MTTISAQVIEDSLSPEGVRLTTMQLRYPRAIHAEFMTHRVFSRNSSSSRAIPVHRLVQDVQDDPFFPISWGSNQKGMQAGEELKGEDRKIAWTEWEIALDNSIQQAQNLANIGAHKQLVNRILEPFSHINVIVTATDWENFFTLRCHQDAEPHIRLLAQRMRDAQNQSTPRQLSRRDIHVPYLTPEDDVDDTEQALKVSVARCARVSYLTHEGKTPSVDKDLDLYNRLIVQEPAHASPTEHQAYPLNDPNEYSGNLRGFKQLRKILAV